MEIVLLEASVTGGFALRGIKGELMFYTLQTETFSKSVPQDTCPKEAPVTKGLGSLELRKLALY